MTDRVENLDVLFYISIFVLAVGAILFLTALILSFFKSEKNKINPDDNETVAFSPSKKKYPDDFHENRFINNSPDRSANSYCRPAPVVQRYTAPYVSADFNVRNPVYNSASIFCLSGAFQGAVFPLAGNEEIVIGSSSEISNIVLDDYRDGISRRHCSVRYDCFRGIYIVTDYSSSGTYLSNGQRLPKNMSVKLESGVIIFLGNGNNSFRLE